MNSFNGIGRLTKDPEIKVTADGMAVCKFVVAINRRFKREGQPNADFIDCTAFSKTAELIGNYFFKGKEIGVSGSLQIDTWEDDKNQKHSRPNIIVDNVTFVGKKDDQEDKRSTPVSQPVAAAPLKKKEKKVEETQPVEPEEDGDDIPAWLKDPENS